MHYEWGPERESKREGVWVSLELRSQEPENQLTFQPHKVTGEVSSPLQDVYL